ncbi:50S ribosomal protein L11 methyltransferase, partial [Janthinobacterium sp.]|uniref:50S ribosomal protein L11 methyltransferase n=1 Tax=Janthinobacterium sp. TaxID=1871054 RepID=UPI0025855498
MPWQELRITTESSHAERFSDALFDLGALSVSVEDAAAGTDAEKPIFGEPGEPVDQMWETSVVLALFDEDIDTSLIVTAASNALELPVPAYDVVRVEEQDWVRLTQSQFNPIP